MKFIITVLLASCAVLQAAPPDLSKVTSRADLDAVLSATTDAPFKQALTDHAAAILAAAERHSHVQAVMRAIDGAPGRYVKINDTPAALKAAVGGDLPIFDTLKEVGTSIKGGRAHDHRKKTEDPYNAAFIEHLGAITSLETLYLEATAIEDSMVAPVLKLKNLKSLSIYGFDRLGDASLNQLQHLKTACPKLTYLELAAFAKATDAGWEKMAGLTNLEHFSVVGFRAKGHCFAKFKGWAKLKNINFHANLLDDEGMGYVCENFPNIEFIKLWHSGLLTDASAGHLGKLRKLKGIEISCKNATAALVKHMNRLPMDYMALEYGVGSPASDAIATVKSIPTLRRLSLDGKALTEVDFKMLSGVTQVEKLSLSNVTLTEGMIALVGDFAFLKELTLANYGKGFPEDIQASVKAKLPKVALRFIK